MAATDCAEAARVGTEDLLKLYAEVVERGADTEIGATAQLKIGFIHLLARRLEEATATFRKVVNDFPAGYAKNNALYALAYCYEKTGRVPDAQRIYQSILDITTRAESPDPIYPDAFPAAWELLLAEEEQPAQSGQQARRGQRQPVVYSDPTMQGFPYVKQLDLQKFAQWRLHQLQNRAGVGVDAEKD